MQESVASKADPALPPAFPVYVPQRLMLAPDNELFVLGNAERELLAKQANCQVSHEEQEEVMASLKAEMAEKSTGLWQQDSYVCSECRATLPTSHLLDVHLAEVHDSFFQAQVARRLPVFQCLVEGCGKTFTSPAHRHQHLVDFHCFPDRPNLSRMHLRTHGPQPRPDQAFQKAAPKPGTSTPGISDPKSSNAEPAESGAAAMEVDESSGPDQHTNGVVGEMSRLTMAHDAEVPSQIGFGRRGRGRIVRAPRGQGRRGRGRAK